MSWCSGFETICRRDVPLAEHTWFGLGGPARWLLTPRDDAELAAVLRACSSHGVPWRILGHGANVLVRDAGFDGAVIRLVGPAWERVDFNGARVRARGGADFPKLVKQTVERGLAGLEGLAGIPGTVGGIIRMNAGGRYGSIADRIQEVELMAPDGTLARVPAASLAFGYRTSAVGDRVVAAATFALTRGDAAAITARFRRIWSEKHASQPAVASHSAGCVFKNPPGNAAGALIDRAGLKGQRRGQAEISPLHANFIVAHPGATAQNVLDLVALAQERVRASYGIELELEVQVW